MAAIVGIHPVKTLKTDRPAVAVIVDAPSGEVAAVAKRLGRDGVEASIATTVTIDDAQLKAVRAHGDVPIPTIAHGGLFGWIRAPVLLRHEARELHLHHHFYYLEPHNPTLGQLLLARTAGAIPVHGSVALSAGTGLSRPLVAGDVVVVSLGSLRQGLRTLDRLAAALHAGGLIGLPLSALAT